MIWETFYHIFNCFREPVGRTSRRVLSSSGVHFGTLFIIYLAPRSKYVFFCKNINCPSGRILLIHLCRINPPIRTSWWGHTFPVGARLWLVLNAIEALPEIMDFLSGHFWVLTLYSFWSKKGDLAFTSYWDSREPGFQYPSISFNILQYPSLSFNILKY